MLGKPYKNKKNTSTDKKLLLMGRKNAGKTSIHSVIFSDIQAQLTKSLPFTNNINSNNVLFLGHKLTINDCGGQDDLIKQYLSDPHQVFVDVQFLVYVFDFQFKKEDQDFSVYKEIIEKLRQYSEDAKIFILFHKTDLIESHKREALFNKYKQKVEEITPKNQLAEIFATSIWDVSLYYAWSVIIKNIIPDVQMFENILSSISELIQCEEIVVVEKSSFLIIGSHNKTQSNEKEILKYERLSGIVKNFKIDCSKRGKEMNSIVIKNQDFTILLEDFTKNTFIILMFYDNELKPGLMSLNIKLVHKWLSENKSEKLDHLKLVW